MTTVFMNVKSTLIQDRQAKLLSVLTAFLLSSGLGLGGLLGLSRCLLGRLLGRSSLLLGSLQLGLLGLNLSDVSIKSSLGDTVGILHGGRPPLRLSGGASSKTRVVSAKEVSSKEERRNEGSAEEGDSLQESEGAGVSDVLETHAEGSLVLGLRSHGGGGGLRAEGGAPQLKAAGGHSRGSKGGGSGHSREEERCPEHCRLGLRSHGG